MTEPAVDPRTVFVEYRPRRLPGKGVVVGVAVVLVLVGAVAMFRTSAAAPESAVRDFFGALANRDAAAALSASAPEVRDQPVRELLSDEVLAADSYHPPDRVEVTEARVEGTVAVVAVEYRIDRQEYTATLQLRRDDGLVNAIRQRWLVLDGIGKLTLTDVPEEITVNGLPIAAYDAQGPRILPALPGSYQVGVPEDNPLWNPIAVTAQVEPQVTTEVSVPLEARPAVRAEIERQVTELLDSCAMSPELEPPGCPFRYNVAGSAEDVQWRIVEYPRLALTAGRESGQLVIVASTPESGQGVAVVTGTRRFVGSFEQPVQFPVTGIVTGDGDSIRFEPTW